MEPAAALTIKYSNSKVPYTSMTMKKKGEENKCWLIIWCGMNFSQRKKKFNQIMLEFFLKNMKQFNSLKDLRNNLDS